MCSSDLLPEFSLCLSRRMTAAFTLGGETTGYFNYLTLTKFWLMKSVLVNQRGRLAQPLSTTYLMANRCYVTRNKETNPIGQRSSSLYLRARNTLQLFLQRGRLAQPLSTTYSNSNWDDCPISSTLPLVHPTGAPMQRLWERLPWRSTLGQCLAALATSQASAQKRTC